MVPGGPSVLYAEPGLRPEDIQRLIEHYGLDKPLYVQYVVFLKGMFSGDFGRSFQYKVPALEVLGYRMWNTLILAGVSFVFAYSFGITMGVLLTRFRGKIVDRVIMVSSFVVRSTPTFWVAMVFIMFFSFTLWWFPHAGMHEPGFIAGDFFHNYFSIDFLRHLFLPVLVDFVYFFSFPMLILRNTMLQIQGDDFVELARAKGLSTNQVLFKHVMRNALLPIVTLMSTYVGMALSGAPALEYVFSWPGLGNELLLSVTRADYPVAQAAFFLLAVTTTVMNLVADLLYGYLDPRVVYK